ncbi:hypothetical protein LAZ67_3003707 [Cordylochernes scorpioides]|uniref:Uncharacterized protein n=1 Tax=Cordylochernes scorpioides TaxID=51811 RepID=A0ABY6K8R9_9ARAC|nr:hypothetical protein LAZ67_3003707 [Cordylochernes scorpioides]
MLGTASNYRQSQTFTKVCLDHGAMINESCTPIPHSMRSDVDLHAASPVAQNKQGRGQDLASKQLRILQCNINGLCSTATKIKLEEIMEIAEKQKIQIIALQETKLNEKYNLKYKNYNILRKDRNKEGGGLAFLIKNLYYEDIAINIPNTSDLEAQGIKVYLSQNKTINIFNMYHPPNNKLIDDGTMAQFLTDNTIIVGDLNAKHQLWGCSMPNPRGKILSNIFDDNAFMCLNDGNPTHHSYSYNTAQALDISFSSPDIFHKCKWQILKSIGSDHLPILIEISTKTKTSSIKEKFWNFKKANWNLYQKNTNEDFRKAPTRIKDLEQNWISFKNTIIKAAKVSIPRGNIKKWIPNYTHQAKDIQTLITKRNELQKKCTQNQTNCRTELNIVNAKIKSTHNIFHEKINMKELDYALENTDLNKTPGPDGIHGQMISNLGKNGKEILLDIFNNSWKTGKLPQDWKTATIIPIKKLDKSADDPKNYRPISLTSICCKLMEKIILRRLTYHLDTRNLLPEEQYGFRKGHGTIDQLLFFTQKKQSFLIKNLYYEDIAINIPNTSDLEAQGIKVYLSQNKTINIFNMYHPPNNKLIDDGTMAQFLTDNTIIVGDLNAKHQLWGCSMPNPRGKILSNLFDDNAFMCLNDGNPTHHSYSYNTAQALDISFSSPDIFHKCKWQILKSIGSDHLPILIEISTKTKTSSIKEKFWNFKKANWNLYQQNTNEDFRKAPTSIKDLEQNWISFKNTIIKAAKVSIPRGNIKKWIPNYTHQAKDIQTLITKRNELQKKCTQNQTNCRTELNIVNAKIKSTHNIFHEKINMKELDYALENTDLNKTPGPDGIHGQMISNLGKNGKERLLDIFNNSWKTGKLPQDWKTATIIPIKKLDKSADDPKNYRPISLTSICCKLMEKIILRRLTYHLDTRNLLPEEQYGFRKGHGTIDQLLFFIQKCCLVLSISDVQSSSACEWYKSHTRYRGTRYYRLVRVVGCGAGVAVAEVCASDGHGDGVVDAIAGGQCRTQLRQTVHHDAHQRQVECGYPGLGVRVREPLVPVMGDTIKGHNLIP